MKKYILTIGFLVSMSAFTFAQTRQNQNPADRKPPASADAPAGTSQPATESQKQREDVQRAGDPANGSAGIKMITPDPRVQSPSTPADSKNDPATPTATPDAPERQAPQNGSTPQTKPMPAEKAVPNAERAGTPATRQSNTKTSKKTKPSKASKSAEKTAPANETKQAQPATQPKKQTPAQPEKTQTPR